ncbi:MAG: hypothetical protein ACP5IB_08095 [Thermoplasmata archaeon]|jgi:hypothetical protein
MKETLVIFRKKYGIPYSIFKKWIETAKIELGKEPESISDLLEVLE